MMHSRQSLLTLLLFLAFVGADAGAQGTARDSTAILEASRQFSTYYVRGDIAALARLFVEDGVLRPPGREVRGRAAIERYFTSGPNPRRVAHRMEPSSIHISGTLAVDVGTWTSSVRRGDSEPVTNSDRYMMVWQREADGVWRILYDMWHIPARP
jgi:ketosteroid isomerase-like protein